MIFNFIKKYFQKEYEVYTDGSHKGRWGAWAYVILEEGQVVQENSGRERRAGSNQMEFRAAIEALEALPENCRALFHTDSRILLDAMTKPVKEDHFNIDQVQILNELCQSRDISWKWVRAHSGNRYNERCDELCVMARCKNIAL